jgi:Sulfotransferase domain
MIIYIASYPRSGNFWLQNLIGNQLKRLTTNIHEGNNHPNVLDIFERFTTFNKEYYDIDVCPLDENLGVKYAELSSWMVHYKSPDDASIHIGILPGCLELLKKTEIRNILAKDNQYYFLKTHFAPYSGYFEGEYILQIIRNPGAVLWSYYNFKRDVMNQNDVNLADLIRNDSDYGDWSQYHIEWMKVSQQLGSRYLLVRYEDIFGKELEFCESLKSFLNLPIKSQELRSFEFYHKLRPALTRQGKAGGWEENYSKDQLRLLWGIHSTVMTQFGYQEPIYDFGLEKAVH